LCSWFTTGLLNTPLPVHCRFYICSRQFGTCSSWTAPGNTQDQSGRQPARAVAYQIKGPGLVLGPSITQTQTTILPLYCLSAAVGLSFQPLPAPLSGDCTYVTLFHHSHGTTQSVPLTAAIQVAVDQSHSNITVLYSLTTH
jgi:hypothetical protein